MKLERNGVTSSYLTCYKSIDIIERLTTTRISVTSTRNSVTATRNSFTATRNSVTTYYEIEP